MNHWVSKHAEDRNKCSACGEHVPNANEDEVTVLVTGDCKGAPSLGERTHIVCGKCVGGVPWMGRYETVDLDGKPHSAFCAQCGRFVGDSPYVVRMPDAQRNRAGRVTSAPVFGIWCEPPAVERAHTCIETATLELGVTTHCTACAERAERYGVARFAQHPGALVELPWSFTVEADAQAVIDEACRVPAEAEAEQILMGPTWSYEVRALTGAS